MCLPFTNSLHEHGHDFTLKIFITEFLRSLSLLFRSGQSQQFSCYNDSLSIISVLVPKYNISSLVYI